MKFISFYSGKRLYNNIANTTNYKKSHLKEILSKNILHPISY